MSNPLISEALSSFLSTTPVNFAQDITSRYSLEMECQINVSPEDGEPVFEGTKRINNTWSCNSPDFGSYKFYHIRIPKQAMSEPYFDDRPIPYPLARHMECCGMTGWNWTRRKSIWVAFDIDSITGHAAGVGVTDEDLNEVRKRASEIPWLQVRRSTGGAGIHLYAYFDPDNLPETENHTVHSAVARCVLGLMEREAGFDFRGNMDVYGGNMWVWHRKITPDNQGLAIIKDFEDFVPKLPDNWRDNIEVVGGKRAKVQVRGVGAEEYDAFDKQASARVKVRVDETHKQIEERIETLGYSIIWIPDHHCWQTHVRAFQDLHEEFPGEYVGIFKTLSQGKDPGKPNCFAFPMVGGGMRVTKFGQGAKEHETWHQDGSDWTWTYFNRAPSLREAASIYGGVEDPDGKGWIFSDLKDVCSTVRALGDELPVEEAWMEQNGENKRNVLLRPNKQNQLVIEMDKLKDEKTPKGWIEKGKKCIKLIRGANTNPTQSEEETNLDDRVRAVVDTNNEFSQWVLLNEDGEWVSQPKDNIRSALKVWNPDNGEEILGKLVIQNWKLVNVPFQPEYLGNRRWNKHAPQLAVSPSETGTPHPHWDMVLDHCGQDLDEVLKTNNWCRENGIVTGADYLCYWLSFTIRDPYCKLPYLFFYGPQNSGKSILHEAASLLMTSGVQLADEALKNAGNFNGELAGAVLCVVEECNLSSANTLAYNRMKAWVTGEDILIHPKKQQPYMLRNTTHWIQCANDKGYVPIFPGDTRIVIMYVPMLDGQEIPKDTMLSKLKDEAPAFLRTLPDLKLPPPPGRMRLPVVMTDSKKEAERVTAGLLDEYLEKGCHHIPGAVTKFADFYDAMQEWMPQDQRYIWTYSRVGDEFRTRDFSPFVFGRGLNNVSCVGNLSLKPKHPNEDYGVEWVRVKQRLVRKGS